MNLSGIRISAGFYDYNSIENRAVTVGSELPAELMQSVTDQAPSTEEYTAPAAIRKSGPDQGAIDYANSYQPDAVYELKGVDSDIARLDVERAISDMRKDCPAWSIFASITGKAKGPSEMASCSGSIVTFNSSSTSTFPMFRAKKRLDASFLEEVQNPEGKIGVRWCLKSDMVFMRVLCFNC